MVDLGFITQFVYENFQQVTISNNGQHFHARCPLCGDSKKSLSKKRFHLDTSKGYVEWRCWNCNRSGSIVKLYCLIKGVNEDEAKQIIFGWNPKTIRDQLEYVEKKKWEKEEEKKVKETIAYNSILNDCVPNSKYSDSLLYNKWINIVDSFRKDRKIPKKYKIFYSFTGKYKGRIIIPVYDKYGDIIYFQGRRLPNSDIYPKYKNPRIKKSMIILNENLFRRDKSIIVFEGLIDAFMVGNQATSCLGKEINDGFIKVLLGKTNEDVILAYDNDEDGIKSLKKFGKKSKYRQQVKYFCMPKEFKEFKDINMLQVKIEIGDVYQFIMDNSYELWELPMILGGIR